MFAKRGNSATPILAIYLAIFWNAPTHAAPSHTKINQHDQLTYIWIPPGSYFTGCGPQDKECIGWERPRQKIVIKRGFLDRSDRSPASRLLSTHHELKHQPLQERPQRPVEQVDWYSATNYCKRVGMRLPIEDEWEYAALGGVQFPRYGALDKIAWYDGNSGNTTHDVAQKQPNAYGLFDMLGNVWEWVEDVCTCDPKRRIMKGGSFYNISRDLRFPKRETPLSGLQHRNIGFRCVANSLPSLCLSLLPRFNRDHLGWRHHYRPPHRNQPHPWLLLLLHPRQHLRPNVIDEPLHLPVHLLHPLPHLQHNRDACDIHAQIPRQIQNKLQPFQILVRIQPRIPFHSARASSNPSRSYNRSVCG